MKMFTVKLSLFITLMAGYVFTSWVRNPKTRLEILMKIAFSDLCFISFVDLLSRKVLAVFVADLISLRNSGQRCFGMLTLSAFVNYQLMIKSEMFNFRINLLFADLYE